MSSRQQVEWDWGPTPAPTGALRSPQTLCASVPDLRVAGSGFHASAVGAVSTSGEPPAPLGCGVSLPCFADGGSDLPEGKAAPTAPRLGRSPTRGAPPPTSGRAAAAACPLALCTENTSLSPVGLRSSVGIIGGHLSPPWVIRGADTQQGHLEVTGSDSSARRCPPGERAPLPPPPPSSLLSGHVASSRNADLQVRSLPGSVS